MVGNVSIHRKTGDANARLFSSRFNVQVSEARERKRGVLSIPSPNSPLFKSITVRELVSITVPNTPPDRDRP